jgi:hypothetical protein
MINFLIESFVVILTNAILFAIVLAVAIRRRLLPVQPEIEQVVDKYFHILFGGDSYERNLQKTIIETTGRLLSGQPYHSGMKFVALSTAIIVVTTVTIIIPQETITPRTTLRAQSRGEKIIEGFRYDEVMLPTVVTPLEDVTA